MTPLEISLNLADLIFIVFVAGIFIYDSVVKDKLVKSQRDRIALLEEKLMIDSTNQVANGLIKTFRVMGFHAEEITEKDLLKKELQEALQDEKYELAEELKQKIENLEGGKPC